MKTLSSPAEPRHVLQHAPSPPSAAPLGKTAIRKVILATSLGNALEFFDFTVYSFFAALIGKLFFPVGEAYGSLLLSFATFGVGFVIRPIGGIVIGTYADRCGRKAAMTVTILMMALGTATIGLAPTYAQIGIAAPLLIVFGRLLQGFSAGGEVGASTTFLMESATPRTRGYLVSWQMASQGAAALAGAFCALLLMHVLPASALERWGWRIPFLLGLLIGPTGLYIRSHLNETLHSAHDDHEQPALPAGRRYDTRRLILGTLVVLGGTSSMYVIVFYLPSYLMSIAHLPTTTAYLPSALSGLVLMIASPLSGRITDRYVRRKPLLLVTGMTSVVVLYPLLALVLHKPAMATLLPCVAAITALKVLSSPAGFLLLMEGFPQDKRGGALGIIYSFGVTLFGGFSPLIVTWLIEVTGRIDAPVWYMGVCGLVSLAALTMFDEVAID